MKSVLLFVSLVPGVCSFAQDENPYDQRGIEYLNTLRMIGDDMAAGKVKELSADAISYYSSRIPLPATLTMESAIGLLKAAKDPQFSLEETIRRSSVSPFVKEVAIETVYKLKGFTREQYLENLVQKVREINANAVASEDDKELALTLIAFNYHAAKSGKERDDDCYATGPDGGMVVDSWICLLLGMGAGFWTGMSICGLWCAVGGAIITGLVFLFC